MAMTREQFEETVNQLEDFARREPSKYKLRVGLLAALGYAYIIAVLAVVALIIGGLVMVAVTRGRLNFLIVKFGWLLITFAAIVLRALWVSIPAPEGHELTRRSAPLLFALVDELTSALDAPRIHHVLIDENFNAGVAQVPRLGPLGWPRNYLVLGLPLMQALSPEHFRAVLAHELGHLSGKHGRFGGWIYRVRQTWFQLLERLEKERRWGSSIFLSFLNWYAPFFNAYSFVLARAHEYEADRASAKLAGARNAAEALLAADVKGAYLSQNYWPEVYKQADTQAEPTRGAFANMSGALRGDLPVADTTKYLQQALAAETGHDDTHPSLSDRLAALNYRPNNNGNNEWAQGYQFTELKESAAQHFLEKALESLNAQMDSAWTQNVAQGWRERHEYAVKSQKALAALEEKAHAGGEPLSADEAWSRAYWTAEFKGTEASLPLLKEVINLQPDHASANYALGQALLEQKDAAGITHLERAMALEPESVLSGCELAYVYLKQQGQLDEAENYRERAHRHYDTLNLAQQERASVSNKDELQPHRVGAEEIERLREQLAQYPHVRVAYFARKRLNYFPEKPLYVLGIGTRYPWYKFRIENAHERLIEEIASQVQFPGETCIILLDQHHKKLAKTLRNIDNAQIYHC